MRKHILLLITLLATLEVTAQNSENFYFSNLNLKDGLSQISVLKIFQDTKGFIWFGTRNGLNRYDGSEFVIYKHDPKDSLTLSDNHIWSLAEDNDRNLWVGTARGLNKLDLKTNRIKPFVDERYGAFAKSEVRCLTVDSRNRLWIGTTKGLYLYVPAMDVFQRIDLNGKIKDEFISAHCHRLHSYFYILWLSIIEKHLHPFRRKRYSKCSFCSLLQFKNCNATYHSILYWRQQFPRNWHYFN